MTSNDSSTHDDDAKEPSSESVAELLRIVSHAPRPKASALTTLPLPAGVRAALSLQPTPSITPPSGDALAQRYRIDEVLGSGGMGIVYAGTHVATGRRVAIKCMRAAGESAGVPERSATVQRFLREARAVGQIRHPHVVDIYDAGSSARGPFLVMELLEGETLRAHLDRRGRLSWQEALAIMLPVIAGVAEAHRHGIVHRDLKPDNVFLTRRDGALTPKVLDFGISRLHTGDGAAGGESSLTHTGAILGTPAYMSLEQLRALGPADVRSDVYALGVMLFELLAGRRPYEARNAADFAALLAVQPPDRLSKYRPDLRGAREFAVMRALSRSASARPASALAFAHSLQRTEERSKLTAVLVGALLLAAAGGLYLLSNAGPSRAGSMTAASTPSAAGSAVGSLRPAPAYESAVGAATASSAPEPTLAPSAPSARFGQRSAATRPRSVPARPLAVPPPPLSPRPPQLPDQASASRPELLGLQESDFRVPAEPRTRSAEGAVNLSADRPARAPSLDLGRDQF